MDELEELIRQKKELEKKIQNLKGKETVCGRVKYEVCRSYGNHIDLALVKVSKSTAYNRLNGYNPNRYFSIIETNSKEDAIKQIDEVIRDLNELKEKLK